MQICSDEYLEEIRMNTSVRSRLLNISRCMGFEQQYVFWSKSKSYLLAATSRQFRREYCGSCSVPSREKWIEIANLRAARQSGNRGAQGLLNRQQRHYSSSSQEGRRWIMKHHFKGMPTMQVRHTTISITTITSGDSPPCPP